MSLDMNLVVVGDCLLDIDLVGSVSRVCPDANSGFRVMISTQTRSHSAHACGVAGSFT